MAANGNRALFRGAPIEKDPVILDIAAIMVQSHARRTDTSEPYHIFPTVAVFNEAQAFMLAEESMEVEHLLEPHYASVLRRASVELMLRVYAQYVHNVKTDKTLQEQWQSARWTQVEGYFHRVSHATIFEWAHSQTRLDIQHAISLVMGRPGNRDWNAVWRVMLATLLTYYRRSPLDPRTNNTANGDIRTVMVEFMMQVIDAPDAPPALQTHARVFRALMGSIAVLQTEAQSCLTPRPPVPSTNKNEGGLPSSLHEMLYYTVPFRTNYYDASSSENQLWGTQLSDMFPLLQDAVQAARTGFDEWRNPRIIGRIDGAWDSWAREPHGHFRPAYCRDRNRGYVSPAWTMEKLFTEVGPRNHETHNWRFLSAELRYRTERIRSDQLTITVGPARPTIEQLHHLRMSDHTFSSPNPNPHQLPESNLITREFMNLDGVSPSPTPIVSPNPAAIMMPSPGPHVPWEPITHGPQAKTRIVPRQYPQSRLRSTYTTRSQRYAAEPLPAYIPLEPINPAERADKDTPSQKAGKRQASECLEDGERSSSSKSRDRMTVANQSDVSMKEVDYDRSTTELTAQPSRDDVKPEEAPGETAIQGMEDAYRSLTVHEPVRASDEDPIVYASRIAEEQRQMAEATAASQQAYFDSIVARERADNEEITRLARANQWDKRTPSPVSVPASPIDLNRPTSPVSQRSAERPADDTTFMDHTILTLSDLVRTQAHQLTQQTRTLARMSARLESMENRQREWEAREREWEADKKAWEKRENSLVLSLRRTVQKLREGNLLPGSPTPAQVEQSHSLPQSTPNPIPTEYDGPSLLPKSGPLMVMTRPDQTIVVTPVPPTPEAYTLRFEMPTTSTTTQRTRSNPKSDDVQQPQRLTKARQSEWSPPTDPLPPAPTPSRVRSLTFEGKDEALEYENSISSHSDDSTDQQDTPVREDSDEQ